MDKIPPHMLIQAAVEASKHAKAKYSQFEVGASLLTSTNKIITGFNIESSSYSLTICAERVSLFKAISEGYETFKALAIYSPKKPYCPPCGACLQVLSDFAPDLKILLTDGKKYKEYKISELLPLAFKENYLQNDK